METVRVCGGHQCALIVNLIIGLAEQISGFSR